MNDLDLLAGIGDETYLPHPAALAPARSRLVAELRADTYAPGAGPATAGTVPVGAVSTLGGASPPGPGGRGPARRDPGRARRWVAVTGVAAAVAAGVVVVTTTPWGSGGVAPASASAADVLDRAATSAAAETGPVPRPDQFIYLRVGDGGGIREVWQSVDGTHDGLSIAEGVRDKLPGCRNGRAEVVGGNRAVPGRTEPCVVNPAVRDLPTTTGGMLTLLATEGGPRTNQKAKLALELALGYLRPASRAALFRALAQVPGVTVVPDARDGAGRSGTGISWSYEGATPSVLVFDRGTYRLLGTNYDSVQAVRIVDRIGQRD